MKEGDEFKPLDLLLEPDGSSTSFAREDPSAPDGFRPIELADTYRSIERLSLPASVPVGVRGYFDTARTLWVFGWFHYPFYTWAALHAGVCAEMGLKARLKAASIELPRGRRNFRGMLEEAAGRGWLRADAFTRMKRRHESAVAFRQMLQAAGVSTAVPQGPEDLQEILAFQLSNFRELRNQYVHADHLFYMAPNAGFTSLEFTRDLLLQLFPGE